MFNFAARPPTNEALYELQKFLLDRIVDFDSEEDRDTGIFSISQLDGFLTAVVSGPEMIPPSVWLPEVWGDFEPEFESDTEAQNYPSTIFGLMNSIASTLMEDPDGYAPMFLDGGYEDPDEPFVNLWCTGYVHGMTLSGDWERGGEER